MVQFMAFISIHMAFIKAFDYFNLKPEFLILTSKFQPKKIAVVGHCLTDVNAFNT